MINVTTQQARRLLMHAQGLMDDPARCAGSPAAVLKLIRRMGFIQLDTINVVDRAHHLILATRSDSYSPAVLDRLHRNHKLFEHWTHDASLIPAEFFSHWRPRFARYRSGSWHRAQMGADADRVIAHVLERVRAEGPLRSVDFEHDGPRAGPRTATSWWNWKPQKLALDYLWRIGELFVVSREGFQKRYDLTERSVPHLHALESPADADHVDWACRSALERLGIASAPEIAGFWRAIKLPVVSQWLESALRDGSIQRVQVECAGEKGSIKSFALPDLARRLRKLPEAPPQMRLLCPFDPVIRDRARLKRLFNFDYSFEAFVPLKKRKHGYYVMPILEGDALVGRADPKFHRDRGVLEIKRVWWEPSVKISRARLRAFESAVERLARSIGAVSVELPPAAAVLRPKASAKPALVGVA